MKCCMQILAVVFFLTGNMKPSAQTNTSPIIRIGDSTADVFKALGEPRVDSPVPGGRHLLIYEQGEIMLKNNKVVSLNLLSEEEVEKNREQYRQRIAEAEKNKLPTEPDTGKKLPGKEELRILEADYRQKIYIEEAYATQAMSTTISYFDLMLLKAGALGRGYSDELLGSLKKNDIDGFYDIEINFDHFRHRFRRNSGAMLELQNCERHYYKFIESYERIQELNKKHDVVLRRLNNGRQ